MYHDLLARFSTVIEVLSDRLLRRRVVISAVVFLVLVILLAGILPWVSAVGAVAVFLLFVLWLASRHLRRVSDRAAGIP